MNSTRRCDRLATIAATVAALVPVALLGGPATAQEVRAGEDPNLSQRIASEQPIAAGRKVLDRGHVDLGPRYLDGRWTLMIHDDQAKSGGGESVWRHADRTVLRVGDAARLAVPDDPAYGFLPSEAGDEVYVVPQTQDLDVVWVGWNTQDPEVMETIDRGVTMRLTGVEGPGSLVVFLQSGDFGEPKVLWDSTAEPEPVWVDVNTHSHANWVFSAPGVYLVQVEVSADLLDGTSVSDVRELRFAVGPQAAAQNAFAARWTGSRPAATDAQPSSARDGEEETDAAGLAVGWIVAIAVAAIGLGAALAVALTRGRAAKRRARAEADTANGRAGG